MKFEERVDACLEFFAAVSTVTMGAVVVFTVLACATCPVFLIISAIVDPDGWKSPQPCRCQCCVCDAGPPPEPLDEHSTILIPSPLPERQ
jgi:hypothetical protein